MRDLSLDLAPPPAFMDEADIRAPRRAVQREHAFQRVAIEFIRKVVLPPMWCTAICHENELTQNARARAKARGVQPGVHDLYVCQAPALSTWIELKWGKNTPSEDQKRVGDILWQCGFTPGFAWTIAEILLILRDAKMKLHGNADNLAIEYHARADAAVKRAEINAGKQKPGKRTPVVKEGRSHQKRWARIQGAMR